MESLNSRYARIERERRFLVPLLPAEAENWEQRQIEDLYIAGTRMRLRKVEGGGKTVYKLGQKIPISFGQHWMTTIYLEESEFYAFNGLPGSRIDKTRMGGGGCAIDVIGDLLIAEFEFENDETFNAFMPPNWVGEEITGRTGYSGFELALKFVTRDPTWRQTT